MALHRIVHGSFRDSVLKRKESNNLLPSLFNTFSSPDKDEDENLLQSKKKQSRLAMKNKEE